MSCRLVPKLVTLNNLGHHNGSKHWYQFPGVYIEVCLLVIEHTQIHTALQRTWLVDTGAAADEPPKPSIMAEKPRFRRRFRIP